MTAAPSQGYPFCPSAYLVDFKPPVDDVAFTGSPTRDGLGTPKTSCAAYDFVYDGGAFDFPDVGGTQTYPEPPAPVDCGRASRAWYCNTPVNWTRAVDEVAGVVVFHSEVDMNHVANFQRSCRSLEDDSRVVRVETRTVNVTGVENVSATTAEVRTYDWDLFVCAVGPHGPGCARDAYAFTCKRFPARFAARAQQLSSVAAAQVGCVFDKASVALETVAPFRDPACPAGWERSRLTFSTADIDAAYAVALVHPAFSAPADLFLNGTRVVLETPCVNTGWTEAGRFRPEAFVEDVQRDGVVGFEFRLSVDEGNGQACNYTAVTVVNASALVVASGFPPVPAPASPAVFGLPGAAAVGAVGAVGATGAVAAAFAGWGAAPVQACPAACPLPPPAPV